MTWCPLRRGGRREVRREGATCGGGRGRRRGGCAACEEEGGGHGDCGGRCCACEVCGLFWSVGTAILFSSGFDTRCFPRA